MSTALLGEGLAGDEVGIRLVYRDQAAPMVLTVSHDIEVLRKPPVEASRDFAFDLSFETETETEIEVVVEAARASYVAHAMEQRLGTRHLVGHRVPFSIGEGGRAIAPAAVSGSGVIDLGFVTPEGFDVETAVASMLPILPKQAVAVGTRWTTERPLRSLEAWSWTAGSLESVHQVVAVETRDARRVVVVHTKSRAELSHPDGDETHSGALERSTTWEFDVDRGRLLRVETEQTTVGQSVVPQGDIDFRQVTRAELSTRAR